MPRNRRGFTLIELLVVVVIIGILARIAIPRMATTKDKAKLASVKSDLHQIEVAEEAHFSSYSAYANKSQLISRLRFVASPGNTFTLSLSGSGYTATVTNASISKNPKKCTVTIGTGPSSTDGTFVCS